jgi:hypothetical protein
MTMPSTVENTNNLQETVKSIISLHAKYIDQCRSIDEYDSPNEMPEYIKIAENLYKEILKEENQNLLSYDHLAYVLFALSDYYKKRLAKDKNNKDIKENYSNILRVVHDFQQHHDCNIELGYYGVILNDIFYNLPKTLPVKKELSERAFSCKKNFEISNNGNHKDISVLNYKSYLRIFDSIYWIDDNIRHFIKVEKDQIFRRAQDFINTFADENLKPVYELSLRTLKTNGTTGKGFQHDNTMINNISKKFFAELFKRDYLKLINIIERFDSPYALADEELKQIPDLISKLDAIYAPVIEAALKDQNDNVKALAKNAFRPFLIFSHIGKLYHGIYTIKILHKAFYENGLNIDAHIKAAFNKFVFLKNIYEDPELNIDNIYKIINIKNSGYILHLISKVCKNSESEELKGLLTKVQELTAEFKQLSGRDAEYFYHQIVLSELLIRFKTAYKEKPIEEAYQYAKSINDLSFLTSIACKYTDLFIKTQDYQKAATLLNDSFKLLFSSEDTLIDEKARLFVASKKLYLSCIKDKSITEDKDRIKLLETLQANLIYQSLLFSDCLNKHQINKIASLEPEGTKVKLLDILEEEKENNKFFSLLTQEIEALTSSSNKDAAENSKTEKSDARFDDLLNECSNLIAEASEIPKSMTKTKIYDKALNSLKDAFKLAKTEEEQNAYEQERSNLLSALQGFKLPFTAPLISELEKLTFIKKEAPVVAATTPVVTKEEEKAVVNKTEPSVVVSKDVEAPTPLTSKPENNAASEVNNIPEKEVKTTVERPKEVKNTQESQVANISSMSEALKPVSSKPKNNSASKVKNIPQKKVKTTVEKPKEVKNTQESQVSSIDSVSEIGSKNPLITSESSIAANTAEAPKPTLSEPKISKIPQKQSDRTIDVPKDVVDENDRINLTEFQPFVVVKGRRDKREARKALKEQENKKAEEALANKNVTETTRTTSTLKAPEKTNPLPIKPSELSKDIKVSKDIKEFNYTKTTKGPSESKKQPFETSSSEMFWPTKEEIDKSAKQNTSNPQPSIVREILVKNTTPPVTPPPVKQVTAAVSNPVAKEMNPTAAPYLVRQNMVPAMPYQAFYPNTSWVDYVQHTNGIKEYNEGVELFNRYKDTKEEGLLEATMQKLEEALKHAEYYKRTDYAAASALYLAQVYPYSQEEFPTVSNYIFGAINATKKFLKSRFDHFGNISTDDLRTFSCIKVLFNETIKYWEASVNNETDVQLRNKQLLDLKTFSVFFEKETDKCFKFAGKEKTYRELEEIRKNLATSQSDISL